MDEWMLVDFVLAGMQFCVFVFFGHHNERVLWTMSRAARGLFTLFITFGILCLLLLDEVVVPSPPTPHLTELHVAIDVLLSLVLATGIFTEASAISDYGCINLTDCSQWLYLKYIYGNLFLPILRLTILGALLSLLQALCSAM